MEPRLQHTQEPAKAEYETEWLTQVAFSIATILFVYVAVYIAIEGSRPFWEFLLVNSNGSMVAKLN